MINMRRLTCIMKAANKLVLRLAFSLAVLSALGGCAVYSPGPGYYVSDGAPIYVAPPPVYVGPPVYADPWYVGPPLWFNFGFSSGHYGGHHGHHGWHGGGHGHRGGHFRH